MRDKNLVSIKDIDRKDILEIFELADYSEKLFTDNKQPLSGRVLASVFFQPSTRTQFSFQSAFLKLGGGYINCSDIEKTRCGHPYYESLDDFSQIISNYCDIVALRTENPNVLQVFLNNSTVPIISAGVGRDEHPTQALIDLFTIKSIWNSIDNQKILIIGTPEQRTINSLLLGLDFWSNIEVMILCQENSKISPLVTKQLRNVKTTLYHSWEDLICSNNLLMVSTIYVAEIYHSNAIETTYQLNYDIINKYFSKDVVVLSPLPRTNELSQDVDDFNGAKYFLQAKFGLYVRAALYLKYFI